MALLSMPMYPIDDCVGGFMAKALPLIHDGGIDVRALKPTSISSRLKFEASSSGIALQDKACSFCLILSPPQRMKELPCAEGTATGVMPLTSSSHSAGERRQPFHAQQLNKPNGYMHCGNHCIHRAI